MTTFDNNLGPKSPKNFVCDNCDYKSSYKRDYFRHLLTKKHKNNVLTTNDNSLGPKSNKHIFSCKHCDKIYKDRAGLWRHNKKCISKNPDDISDKELIVMLIKQNAELLDVIKNGSGNTTISNNNNNNKTFNLQFFLNETCKDALNISDFVSSIKVSLEDLENTGRKGYVEGISNIILKNLKDLQQHERPIHCSDMKREVLYIKEKNEWTKETEDKPVLTNAIKVIANENIKKIKDWRDQNPECTDVNSKKNNLYLKIVSNSMNGLTKEESDKNVNKIISNVAKETAIDK